MYKCNCCGGIFETPKKDFDYAEAWGHNVEIPYSVSPCCEEDFTEVEPCKICGEFDGMETGEEICEECKKEILKRFRTLVSDNFTVEERTILNELLDGETIWGGEK